jgi:hypothetical protein
LLPPRRKHLCVTVDQIVAGVHFSLRYFRFEDIGYKALAVNLSDLAAMGARPLWFVCALALPPRLSDRAVARVAAGMSALAQAQRIVLVGGNITSSRELSITITAAGEVKRSRAWTSSTYPERSGTRALDWHSSSEGSEERRATDSCGRSRGFDWAGWLPRTLGQPSMSRTGSLKIFRTCAMPPAWALRWR